jgi:hypothetical protein
MASAMAQAFCRWPLTTGTRVRTQVIRCRICDGESGTGTGFSPSSSVSPVSVIALWLSVLISAP